MKYFWFFLHWFEPVMNKTITNELTRRDKYDYNPNRFMIIKSDYLMFLLKSFQRMPSDKLLPQRLTITAIGFLTKILSLVILFP